LIQNYSNSFQGVFASCVKFKCFSDKRCFFAININRGQVPRKMDTNVYTLGQ